MTAATDALVHMCAEIGPFADLGTAAPTIVSESLGDGFIHLVRNGEETQLSMDDTSVMERVGNGSPVRHASFRALLASDRYGALRGWAAQQALLLRQETDTIGALIEQTGNINSSMDDVGILDVDRLLITDQLPGSTRVLLIDGPAGIGKTNFILNLALQRSEQYLANRNPLILHVESRGRQLSYIYDLIAFSLQRLRSTVTFDQIPLLVRNGLITIAIDGFDELADPNGYNLAWAQVNELVQSVRGSGSLILAGRETFIGRKRVEKDITALRDGIDVIDSFTLTSPSPSKARSWLKEQQLTDSQISQLEGLLERGSLALRPFFLKKLADPELVSRLNESTVGSALNFLIEAMISREAGKFGDEVDASLTVEEKVHFVRSMMYEVARDMADNQTIAIAESTLSWLVDVSVTKKVTQQIEFLLKNRAPYLGFLTVDARPRHLRFFHDKFLEYFLARVVIQTVKSGEVPKFVARNIFGASFLETFGSVLGAPLENGEEAKFQRGAIALLQAGGSFNRGSKNLAAFLLATLHLATGDEAISLQDVEIDEARIVGTAAKACLSDCIISQLDVRDADVSQVEFVATTVLTLIANDDTLVKDASIAPHRLVIVADGEQSVESDVAIISEWLSKHSLSPPPTDSKLLPLEFYETPLVRLLSKAARLRQYWLRRGDDKFADRVLSDANWKTLERLLASNNLLTIEERQAAGTDATFYHIRYAGDILSEERSNSNILGFYRDLKRELS